MRAHWILHEAVLRDDVLGCRVDEARAVVGALGMTCEVHRGRTAHDWRPEAGPGRPVVAMATLQMARRLLAPEHRGLVPGVFLNPDRFRQSHYAARLGDLLLNDDQVFLPWGEFVRRGRAWLDAPQGRSGVVFVRPDSGFKTFAGQTLDVSRLAAEAAALDAVSGVTAETLVGVSAPKEVHPIEWRFWIVDGAVAAAAPYSWEDRSGAPAEPPAEVAALAAEVASRPWQVDRAYVADVVVASGRGARLVEINSASTSGVYGVDLGRLLPALGAAAEDEWRLVSGADAVR